MSAAWRKYPFTIVMLILLVLAGIYGRSHLGELDAVLHEQAGYSPRHLWEGQLHRIFTSLLFTAGGRRFYASLLMFALSVGWIEREYGTRGAMLTFFGVHVATQLILAVAVAGPLVGLGTDHGRFLLEARDVGPSAGYYGCLGLASRRPLWRKTWPRRRLDPGDSGDPRRLVHGMVARSRAA